MGKPAVPVPTQLSVSQGYTIGEPDKKPPASSVTLAPSVGGIAQKNFPILCGVDAQTGSIAYAGGTLSFVIPLPNLPAPFVVGQSDKAQFLVALAGFAFPAGTADAVISVALTPQALAGNTPIVTASGGFLRQGATYTGWQVLVTAAAVAGSAGTLTVGVSAWLYDSPLVQQ
jgi:hypothetical protein